MQIKIETNIYPQWDDTYTMTSIENKIKQKQMKKLLLIVTYNLQMLLYYLVQGFHGLSSAYVTKKFCGLDNE